MKVLEGRTWPDLPVRRSSSCGCLDDGRGTRLGCRRLPQTYGWRGNWTGLYPDADPPTTWGKIQKGIVAGMTCQAAKPAEGAKASGQRLVDAMIRDWLVIGPFEVSDPVADFAKEAIPGEANLAPAEGDKVGELAWKRVEPRRSPTPSARAASIWNGSTSSSRSASSRRASPTPTPTSTPRGRAK